MTVESTITRSTLAFLMTPARRAASMVAISSVSTPCAPIRLLQRVRLDASIGALVCRYISPVKCCQYGFSTQVLTTASSEAWKACCRYSKPATRRGGNAGRPRAQLKQAPKVRSISAQSMNSPSRTSGCFKSICSSSRGRDNLPVCGTIGLGPISNLCAICKETALYNPIACNWRNRQIRKSSS